MANADRPAATRTRRIAHSIARATLVVAGAAGLASCGHLSFKDAGGTEIGVPIYKPKPYLLVVRNATKDDTNTAEIVYLPDLSSPIWVRPIPGWGSADLSLNVTNGMMTSFGQNTDPKIADLLNAVGGLATSYAGARKTLSEIKAAADAARQQALSLDDAKLLASSARDLRAVLDSPQGKEFLLDTERDVLASAAVQLDALAKAISDPTKPFDAKGASDRLDGIVRSLRNVRASTRVAAAAPLVERIAAVIKVLESIQANAMNAAESSPTELYEIDNTSGSTVLKRVRIVEP